MYRPKEANHDYAFTSFGVAPTISVPDDVWRTFVSKRRPYTMAYPADWTAPGDEKFD